jgi:hypothetical protein
MKRRWIPLGAACLIALGVYSGTSGEAVAGRHGSSGGMMWQGAAGSGASSGAMTKARNRTNRQEQVSRGTGKGSGVALGVCDGSGMMGVKAGVR